MCPKAAANLPAIAFRVFANRASYVKAMQIRVTHLHRFQRRLLAPVLLDEVVLHPRGGRGREDALPIDGAVTHGREHAHLIVLLLLSRGMVLHILDVEQREAARIFLEVGHRILAGVRHPEAVHFKLDELRIEDFEKIIIRRGVAELLEFEVVVVIAVLNAGLLGLLAGLVEEFGQVLPVIKGFPLLGVEDGIHHVFHADDFGILDFLFPVPLQMLGHVVPAGSGEAVIFQDLGKFRRRLPVQVVNLHFLDANRRDLLERAQHVFLEVIAEREELEAHGLAVRIGEKAARCACVAAARLAPRALVRKKFRRFIIAVISPVI
jgi:hypothetical protein